MTQLYPLKFKPIFKEKIWGGDKIKTILGKDYTPLKNCGELWALSDVEGDVSVVQNGFLKNNTLNEIIEIYMDELVGDSVFQKYGHTFPILIKFLNSSDYLSVQVHPDDDLAWKKHGCKGKTEMWYIIDSDNDSELIIGLKPDTDKKTFEKKLEQNDIKSLLNNVKIAKGDAFYIPAGRVHAIGKGILLAEIQQTSDVTYRIYDWDRKDNKGNARELHINEALEAINFENIDNYYNYYSRIHHIPSEIVKSPFFNVNNLIIEKPFTTDLTYRDSFTIYVCSEGNMNVNYFEHNIILSAGECILIPAELNEITLNPLVKTHLLEVFIEN